MINFKLHEIMSIKNELVEIVQQNYAPPFSFFQHIV